MSRCKIYLVCSPLPLPETYLDAPNAMLPPEFFAVLQPGDGGGRVASSWAAEADSVCSWHSQQFLIHTLWSSPIRSP